MCKVVDNFGDAGFVVRLCRALLEAREKLYLRVVCDDVTLFSRLEPSLSSNEPALGSKRVAVFDWNATDVCQHEFSHHPPRIILECFQCARPLWLDAILFESNFTQTVQIVNIEYLTAEEWSEGFHLLKSGTRAANIKKVNFMPGFSAKTGGLLLDDPFLHCKEDRLYARRLLSETLGLGFVGNGFDSSFKVLVFSYERNLTFLARALRRLSCVRRVRIFAASGVGLLSAQEAFSKEGVKFTALPFLPQRVWDALMSLVDFAFVRGEDSFARACLIGKPFVWQAYPQKEQFHLVKLSAFLHRLKAPALDRFSFLYNWDPTQEAGYEAWDILSRQGIAEFLQNATSDCLEEALEDEAFSLLEAASRGEWQLIAPFESFSSTLLANGNLAEHLLSYLDTLGW